ncbi:MAG TPA: VOC family protein [bacterium]|nr:VOC family protein [bacterium]
MATQTKHAHGVFSWVQLGVPDTAPAKPFYGSLFGWEFEDMPAGPGMTYAFIKYKGKSVGGLAALPKEVIAKGVPSHWLPFVNVTNVDDVVKKAKQSGGKLPMGEAMDVLDAGRMAFLQDPTGAHFAIWQAKTHQGADVVNEIGAMCWNELMTSDTEAAGRFYKTTFGWNAEQVDMGEDGTYTIFKIGEKQISGMMKRPPRLKDVPPNWLTYFAVTNVDDMAKKAASLGGKIFQPPMDIPDIGRFAVIQDPQGAVFALFKPKA